MSILHADHLSAATAPEDFGRGVGRRRVSGALGLERLDVSFVTVPRSRKPLFVPANLVAEPLVAVFDSHVEVSAEGAEPVKLEPGALARISAGATWTVRAHKADALLLVTSAVPPPPPSSASTA